MASQEQNIEDSSLENSQIQQAQAEDNVVAIQGDNNKFAINQIFLQFFGKPEPPKVDWEWGKQKLNQQLPNICKRLKDTLGYDRTLMDVTAEEQPSWVHRSLQAERTLQVDGQDYGLLNPNIPLIKTFKRDHIAGKLLILGAPGAGKTTALLSLAEQLVREALEKPTTVIPILFELSTWRDDNQNIHDWLVEQLYDLFGGKRKYKRYETWLEQQVLLPLMDGLDELGLERQKKCTIKLKQFSRQYPHIVICCRDKEFDAVDIPNPLPGKVYLKPLADKQIQDYLESKNHSELWSKIQAQPDLRKLLEPTIEDDPGLFRVPLFLKLAADVYDPQKPILNKSDLLEKYIEKQLCPETRKQDRRQDLENRQWAYKTVEEEPDWRQTRKTLSWVARQLNDNHSVELLIEKIQPNWLKNKCQRWQYRLIVGLFVGLTITIVAPILFLLTPTYGIKLEARLLAGLGLGFIFGLISVPILVLCMLKLKDIKPVESLAIKGRKICKAFLVSLFVTGVFTCFICIIVRIIEWTKASVPFIELFVKASVPFIELFVKASVPFIELFVPIILISIPIMVFMFSLLAGLQAELVPKNRIVPNQGTKNSYRNMCILTIIIMPVVFFYTRILEVFMPAIFLEKLPISWNLILLICSIGFCLSAGGGWALIQHIALRIVLKMNGYAPYRFDKFLKYCIERKLLYPVGGRYRFLHRELLNHFDPSKR
jgi:DNA polymerase III delta prime subunit